MAQRDAGDLSSSPDPASVPGVAFIHSPNTDWIPGSILGAWDKPVNIHLLAS